MRTIKILALTDLHSHGNLELVEVKNLVNDEKIDIITLLGDLTTFGNVPLIKSILEQFDSIGKPVLYVPGNMDTEKATDIEFSNIIPIHGRMRNILGINFIGLGASNPTPFRVPFILTEKALNELLQNAIAMKNTDDPLIFISHAPPLDSEADITRAGEHVGSSSVRKFVEDYQPEIILCGHIHESESISKIEKTLCINPGPFAHGNVAIAVIEIDDSKGVKTKGKILTI